MNGELDQGVPGCTCPATKGEMHTCPFAEGIRDDSERTECDCCPACENECAMDI